MADGYRSLSIGEIRGLEAAGCRSNSWESIFRITSYNVCYTKLLRFWNRSIAGSFNVFASEHIDSCARFMQLDVLF